MIEVHFRTYEKNKKIVPHRTGINYWIPKKNVTISIAFLCLPESAIHPLQIVEVHFYLFFDFVDEHKRHKHL